MYDLAKEGLILAHEQMDFMLAVINNMKKRDWTEVGGKQIPLPKTLGYHNQGAWQHILLYASSNLDENPGWDPSALDRCPALGLVYGRRRGKPR